MKVITHWIGREGSSQDRSLNSGSKAEITTIIFLIQYVVYIWPSILNNINIEDLQETDLKRLVKIDEADIEIFWLFILSRAVTVSDFHDYHGQRIGIIATIGMRCH